MKLFKLFVFLLTLTSSIYAQNTNLNQGANVFNAAMNWGEKPVQKYTQNGIIFKFNLEKCNNPSVGMEKDYILITIENSTLKAVDISLHQNLYFDGIYRTCSRDEYTHKYTVPPEGQLTGSCESPSSEGLKLFHGSPWVTEEMTNFEFVNIKIRNQ